MNGILLRASSPPLELKAEQRCRKAGPSETSTLVFSGHEGPAESRSDGENTIGGRGGGGVGGGRSLLSLFKGSKVAVGDH